MSTKLSKTSHFDVIIIGANISGALMALRLEQEKNQFKIVVFEKTGISECYKNSDIIPFYINRRVDIPNIEWKCVSITTQLWDNYMFFSVADEKQRAMYAKKITGRHCKTTLDSITHKKTIFIPTNHKVDGRQKVILSSSYDSLKTTSIYFSRQVISIDINKKEVHDNHGNTVKYKYLISTIPLPQLLSMLNITSEFELPCYKKDFYINIIETDLANKYHVIYCSDPKVRINRIAYLRNKLYIESPIKIQLNTLNSTERAFIEHSKKTFRVADLPLQFKNASYPRFVENDADETNRFTEFLKIHDVFLLGRYASWRFLLTEDIWDKTNDIVCAMKGGKV